MTLSDSLREYTARVDGFSIYTSADAGRNGLVDS
jgi:hypothetical protein